MIRTTSTSAQLAWNVGTDKTYDYITYLVEYSDDASAIPNGATFELKKWGVGKSTTWTEVTRDVMDSPYHARTSYTVEGLVEGRQYAIRIRVGNHAGFAAFGSTVFVYPHAAPSSPNNVRVGDSISTGVTPDSLTINWDRVATTTYFVIEVKEGHLDDTEYISVATVNSTVTSYVIGGLSLTHRMSYTIRVTAGNLAGLGTHSTCSSMPIDALTATDVVENVHITQMSKTSLQIAWDAHHNATVYKVEFKAKFLLCIGHLAMGWTLLQPVLRYTTSTTLATLSISCGLPPVTRSVIPLRPLRYRASHTISRIFNTSNRGCHPSRLDQYQFYREDSIDTTSIGQAITAVRTGYLEKISMFASIADGSQAAPDIVVRVYDLSDLTSPLETFMFASVPMTGNAAFIDLPLAENDNGNAGLCLQDRTQYLLTFSSTYSLLSLPRPWSMGGIRSTRRWCLPRAKRCLGPRANVF